MRELYARRASLTDAEATARPTPLDADALGRMPISTGDALAESLEAFIASSMPTPAADVVHILGA